MKGWINGFDGLIGKTSLLEICVNNMGAMIVDRLS